MSQQPNKMSGVSAHCQTAVAEHAIGTIVHSACTMLLHAAIYWPDKTDLLFWPFALQYVADLWNHMPDIQSGLSPIDKFSGTVNDHTHLLGAH
eukprot:5043030-Ditylum_brightwellii.AAC.1